MDLSKVVASLSQLVRNKNNCIVAIDGRSGSGKTTVASELSSKIPSSKVVHTDEFDLYQGTSSIDRLIKEEVMPHKTSQASSNLLILEGIFSHDAKLQQYLDFKIWVDVDREIGFKRGLARDIAFNGHDNSEKWLNYWLPLEDKYITEQNPQIKADIVISNLQGQAL